MELKSIIDSAWNAQFESLQMKVRIAYQQVSDILLVEENKRKVETSNSLEKKLGPLAESMLNLNTIAKVLSDQSQSKSLDPVTLSRVTNLANKLKDWSENLLTKVPKALILDVADLQTIESKAVMHLSQCAECFSLIRQAWLERNSKYEPKVHEQFFQSFTWESMSNDEVALCPPIVVTLKESKDRSEIFNFILPLLTSGIPYKVLLEKSNFRTHFQTLGRSAALRCSLEIEMLPIALKGVFVLQDTVARKDAIEGLLKGLKSPRPALFSIFNDTDTGRCENAVASRAIPLFSYDPDRSPIFLKRFELRGNPDLNRSWSQRTLEFIEPNGKKDRLLQNFTFADFAATESGYQADFSDLPADVADKAIDLSAYLDLPSSSRSGKIPFIQTLNSNGMLVKKVPSLKVVAQSSDKLHLWKSLCEVAGINNPHITELEQQLRTESLKVQQDLLQKQNDEWEQTCKEREMVAVRNAMSRLAQRLVSGETVTLQDAAQPAETGKAKPIVSQKINDSSKSESTDEPYIDSKSCTACDECVTIDPRIFAYNKDKQAYIKDPKGGPYKNLLKASQKCSAKIIHPGKAWE